MILTVNLFLTITVFNSYWRNKLYISKYIVKNKTMVLELIFNCDLHTKLVLQDYYY